jgi:hypothetical protein
MLDLLVPVAEAQKSAAATSQATYQKGLQLFSAVTWQRPCGI